MRVPDMVLHDGDKVFSRHAKLPGVPLTAEVYDALRDDRRDLVAQDLGRLFAELHAIDIPVMRAAGAERAGLWDTEEKTLAAVWPVLPTAVRVAAYEAIAAYRALPPDPLGTVYGYFDAHGWNLAFDPHTARLTGAFDFADSGFGEPHRELVQPSLISAELPERIASAYQHLTGNRLNRRRVHLLTAAMRLSELAGSIETGQGVQQMTDLVVRWFSAGE